MIGVMAVMDTALPTRSLPYPAQIARDLPASHIEADQRYVAEVGFVISVLRSPASVVVVAGGGHPRRERQLAGHL